MKQVYVGTDKLVLSSKHFRLKEGHRFTTKFDLTPEGEYIEKKKICNTNNVSFDIDTRGLRVLCNPSVIANTGETNYLSKTVTDRQKTYDYVMSQANNVGLEFCLTTSGISRLDLARDSVMSQGVSDYFPVFQFMNCSRMQKRGYPSGYMHENKQRELMFYDRGEKLFIDTQESIGSNTARLELKLKKTKEVQKKTGLCTYSDFMKVAPIDLQDIYINHLTSDVFRSPESFSDTLRHLDLTGERINILDSETESIILRDVFNGNFKDYVMSFALEEFENKLRDSEQIKTIVLDSGRCIRTANRNIRQFANLRNKLSLLGTQRPLGQTMKMYNELYNKFAIAV